MSSNKKKSFLAKHAKSSAVFVSLALHGIILLVALTFVAVTVITKDDQKFEAKPVNRPRMQLKKLQVPVNIKKKKTQKPKLRKRIVVKPTLAKVPDIKMPEISGVKGGLGNASGNGLGGAGGIGFNLPEMNLFGVKSQGEKVYIILDASGFMMVDSMGGIPAYEIIKSELVRILEGLNPAVLFNIAIYENSQSYQLFSGLVSANDVNVSKVDVWLKPLNAVKTGMGNRDYGVRTQGEGSLKINDELQVKPLQDTPGDWAKPALQAMQQQADVIFVLSCRWGSSLRYKAGTRDTGWSESDQLRYEENIVKAKALHKKENERRRAKGQAPRVVTGSDRSMVKTYLPTAKLPPSNTEWYWYTPDEMAQALGNMFASSKSSAALKSGLSRSRSRKDQFTLNVIHFVPEGADPEKDDRLNQISKITRGEYSRVEGMAAIQSYVSTAEADLASTLR